MTATPVTVEHGTTEGQADYVRLAEAAYNTYAPWYDRMYRLQGTKSQVYRNALAAALSRLVEGLGARKVLDCACGTGDPMMGLLLDERLQAGGVEFAVSDGSEGMLRLFEAYEREVLGGKGPLPVHAQWHMLPEAFPGAAFDLVLCLGHGLFHLVTAEAMLTALRAMFNVLRPGGHLLIDCRRHPAPEGEKDIEEHGGRLRAYHAEEGAQEAQIYLSTVRCFPSKDAVDGMLQRKCFHVLEETVDGVISLCSATFLGAPLRSATLEGLLVAAGFSGVRETDLDGKLTADHMTRYCTVIGRRPE